MFGAEAIGVQNDLGSIEAGRLADLMIFEQNYPQRNDRCRYLGVDRRPRDDAGPTARVLKGLLDDDLVALISPVKVELLSGVGAATQRNLRRLLSALPLWSPQDSTWELVDSWLEPTATAGDRFGLADLLIGATAAERRALLWSFDSDFTRMADRGFFELFNTN